MAPLPSNLREFDDAGAARTMIYDYMEEAVTKRFPIEDKDFRLELSNVRYDGPKDFNLEKQKHTHLLS